MDWIVVRTCNITQDFRGSFASEAENENVVFLPSVGGRFAVALLQTHLEGEAGQCRLRPLPNFTGLNIEIAEYQNGIKVTSYKLKK
jgi:hypothetical protein